MDKTTNRTVSRRQTETDRHHHKPRVSPLASIRHERQAKTRKGRARNLPNEAWTHTHVQNRHAASAAGAWRQLAVGLITGAKTDIKTTLHGALVAS